MLVRCVVTCIHRPFNSRFLLAICHTSCRISYSLSYQLINPPFTPITNNATHCHDTYLDSFHVHNLRTRVEYQPFCPHRPCEGQYISSGTFCHKNLAMKCSRLATLREDLIGE
jgi:hypothetical protein